jgi:probable F420-dependent oxidoreductase
MVTGVIESKPVRTTLRLPIASEPGSDPGSLIELARRAESVGFGAVSISDHVVMGPHADRYPWGDFSFPPEAPWYEPLTVLTAIAAATSRIGLTTSILIVPLRPAALLAKWAATIDVVSGGRMELGVGTGWQKAEFDALGLDHARRGQMLTDSIGACRTLWRHAPASWSSPTVNFSDIWCLPRPVESSGIPILFSGTLTPRNVRRIVGLGDGWIPIMGERRAGIADGVAQLRSRYEAAGRDPGTLRVRSAARIGRDAAGTPGIGVTLERSRDLIEAGVTDLDIPLTMFPDRERFFDEAAKAIAGTDWLAK